MSDIADNIAGVYKPSAWQEEYHTCPVDFLLGAGAAGVGKTMGLLGDPLSQVLVEHERCLLPKGHPRRLEWGRSMGWALHLRRELKQLEQTIERSHRMYPDIDSHAKYSNETKTWKFRSGYRMQFGHCQNSNDHEQYLSSEYTHLGLDELTTFEKRQVDMIRSRVRSSDPILRKMAKVRAMSNPGKSPGADADWVRKMFIDPHPAGRKILVKLNRRRDGTSSRKTHMYLPGRLSDNPDRDFATDYEDRLIDLPEHIVRAYLDGDWYFLPGAFFAGAWDQAFHVVRNYRIPRHWKVFRCMDWGFRLPGCVHWIAIDDDGNLIVFEELKFQEMVDERVAQRIKSIEIRHGLWNLKEDHSRITGPADTQIWEERGDSAKKKAEVFEENGIIWHPADKHPHSRKHHAQRVTKLLKSHRGGTRTPGIVFMNHCTYAISTIPQLPTDKDDPEQPAKTDDDHAYDSIAYGVAWASNGSQSISIEREDSVDDELDKIFAVEESTSNKANYGYGLW